MSFKSGIIVTLAAIGIFGFDLQAATAQKNETQFPKTFRGLLKVGQKVGVISGANGYQLSIVDGKDEKSNLNLQQRIRDLSQKIRGATDPEIRRQISEELRDLMQNSTPRILRGRVYEVVVVGQDYVGLRTSGQQLFVPLTRIHSIQKDEPRDSPKTTSERRAMTTLNAIKTGLATFLLDVGRYPTEDEGLDALLSSPQGLGEKWSGPYLSSDKILTDPWNRPIYYKFEPKKITVGSSGPDRQAGTEDDISVVFR